MKATKIAFEQQYSDGSGVEFAVRLNGDDIEFESTGSKRIIFPVDEVEWLIAALTRIQSEAAA